MPIGGAVFEARMGFAISLRRIEFGQESQPRAARRFVAFSCTTLHFGFGQPRSIQRSKGVRKAESKRTLASREQLRRRSLAPLRAAASRGRPFLLAHPGSCPRVVRAFVL
jgi:hypothetical protein